MASFPQVSPTKTLNKPLRSPIRSTWLDLSRTKSVNPIGSGLKFKKTVLFYALLDEGLIICESFLLEKKSDISNLKVYSYHTNVLRSLRVRVYVFKEYDFSSLANRIRTFRKNVISTYSRTEMSM